MGLCIPRSLFAVSGSTATASAQLNVDEETRPDAFPLFEVRSSASQPHASNVMSRMDEQQADTQGRDGPAGEFDLHRERLNKLACRMLGDAGDAEDVVQESWLRLQRSGPDDVRSLGAWLTTVVTRLCLDSLRARSRRNLGRSPLDVRQLDIADERFGTPEQQIVLADSLGVALFVVLERLNPAERVAFVLHDVFDIPFEEVAPLIGRSEIAARQLASRARRRVRGLGDVASGDVARHAALAERFLGAARTGDIPTLLRLLAPDVTLRPDATAARLGPGGEVRGAEDVAKFFVRRGAGAAHVAMVDGAIGLIVATNDLLLLALRPTFEDARIAAFDAIADPDALAALELALPGAALSRY